MHGACSEFGSTCRLVFIKCGPWGVCFVSFLYLEDEKSAQCYDYNLLMIFFKEVSSHLPCKHVSLRLEVSSQLIEHCLAWFWTISSFSVVWIWKGFNMLDIPRLPDQRTLNVAVHGLGGQLCELQLTADWPLRCLGAYGRREDPTVMLKHQTIEAEQTQHLC